MFTLPDSRDEKGVTIFFNLIYKYLYDDMKITNASIARRLGISVSYIHTLKHTNSRISSATKREYVIGLMKNFNVSVEINENGVLYIKQHKDDSFYYVNFNGFFYNRETAEIETFKFKIDFIRNFVISEDLFSHNMFAGRYTISKEISSFQMNMNSYQTNILHNYSNNEFNKGKKQDITYSCRVDGDINNSSEKSLFGFFTRSDSRISVSTGRLVFTPKALEELPIEVVYFLSNESFHQYFDYKVKIGNNDELLKCYKDYKDKNNIFQIKLPYEFSGIWHQFLSFFSDFVKIIKGKSIDFNVIRNNDGLELKIELDSEDLTVKDIEGYMAEYVKFTEQNLESLKINVETEISEREFDIFVLELKGQINNLQQRLEIANLKNHHLQNETDTLKSILGQVLSKDTTIRVQLITGGEQQFADKINNNKL